MDGNPQILHIWGLLQSKQRMSVIIQKYEVFGNRFQV